MNCCLTIIENATNTFDLRLPKDTDQNKDPHYMQSGFILKLMVKRHASHPDSQALFSAQTGDPEVIIDTYIHARVNVPPDVTDGLADVTLFVEARLDNGTISIATLDITPARVLRSIFEIPFAA